MAWNQPALLSCLFWPILCPNPASANREIPLEIDQDGYVVGLPSRVQPTRIVVARDPGDRIGTISISSSAGEYQVPPCLFPLFELPSWQSISARADPNASYVTFELPRESLPLGTYRGFDLSFDLLQMRPTMAAEHIVEFDAENKMWVWYRVPIAPEPCADLSLGAWRKEDSDWRRDPPPEVADLLNLHGKTLPPGRTIPVSKTQVGNAAERLKFIEARSLECSVAALMVPEADRRMVLEWCSNGSGRRPLLVRSVSADDRFVRIVTALGYMGVQSSPGRSPIRWPVVVLSEFYPGEVYVYTSDSP